MPASDSRLPTTPRPAALARANAALAWVPEPLRRGLLTLCFTRTVRFAGTGGVRFESLDDSRAILHLPDRQRVRNHIGTVHAAATALLAETASGAVFGINVPADRIPLLKSMQIDYLCRSNGALRAEATMSEAARNAIRNDERGEIDVPVTITDADGTEPVRCTMIWAWIPKHAN